MLKLFKKRTSRNLFVCAAICFSYAATEISPFDFTHSWHEIAHIEQIDAQNTLCEVKNYHQILESLSSYTYILSPAAFVGCLAVFALCTTSIPIITITIPGRSPPQ